MIWRRTLLLLMVGTTMSPEPAGACGTTPSFGVIHSEVPPDLPDDLIVAKVHILDKDQWLLYSSGLTAEVESMRQGVYLGRRIILRTTVWTSCDRPFANGTSGYIIGQATGWQEDELVVEPIPSFAGETPDLSELTKQKPSSLPPKE